MFNVVNTLAPSFLIGTASFLQVARTIIKSRMSTKFGQIRPWTAELSVIEGLKKLTIDLQREKCCDHSSAFIFDGNYFSLARNKDIHKSLNEFQISPRSDH